MKKLLKIIVSISLFIVGIGQLFFYDYSDYDQNNSGWLYQIAESIIIYVVVPIGGLGFIVWFESGKKNTRSSESFSLNILQSILKRIPLPFRLPIKIVLYLSVLYVCFYAWIELF